MDRLDGSDRNGDYHHHGSGSMNHIARRHQLYIGNLSWWTTDQDIADVIGDVGVNDFQEVKFFENRANGQSKGFCVVSLGSENSMRYVMERLPKKELHGQNPVVTLPTKQALNQFESQQKTRPTPPAQSGGQSNGPRPPAPGMGGMGPGPGGPHGGPGGPNGPPGPPRMLMGGPGGMPPGMRPPHNHPMPGPMHMQGPPGPGGPPRPQVSPPHNSTLIRVLASSVSFSPFSGPSDASRKWAPTARSSPSLPGWARPVERTAAYERSAWTARGRTGWPGARYASQTANGK